MPEVWVALTFPTTSELMLRRIRMMQALRIERLEIHSGPLLAPAVTRQTKRGE